MKSGIRPWAAVWRPRYNRMKENRTGGFTLVELIVVLVVLGILCSIAVMSIIGWQDYADFKKQNEFAQTIFVAAQTQLTQYGERGQLTALKEQITVDADGDAVEESSYLVPVDELGLQDGEIWQKYKDSDQSNVGTIYYLMAKKGDYAGNGSDGENQDNYLKLRSQRESDPGTKFTPEQRRLLALFDMLDPYVSDKEMLNAAICIEFDPDPKVALVYSVFYDEKVREFTYDRAEDAKVDAASIRDRREAERKKKTVGYYGADTLARGTNSDIGRPILSNVRLNNEDTLNLTWSVNSLEALKGLLYTIDLYCDDKTEPDGDDEAAELVASISLGDADSGNEELDIRNGLITGTYVRYQNQAVVSTKTLEFPIELNNSERKITLVLDGLDLSADESGAREDSASIYRLGLDEIDRIYCMISGSRAGKYDLTRPKKSNTEHQYMGGIQQSGQARTLTVGNVRHLNNIRYYEKLHGAQSLKLTYKVSSDMDWDVVLRRGNVYQALSMVDMDYVAGIDDTQRLNQYFFRPILSLEENSALLTDGLESAHILKNFRFRLADVPAHEGNGSIPQNTTGLFVVNRGTIQNLGMESVNVHGRTNEAPAAADEGATGTFCGLNQGILSDLTVRSGVVKGSAYVGGIMGKADGATASGTYRNLVNRADVSGETYVGGIVGSIDSENGAIVIENCKNYGKVQGITGEKETYFIGGIAGQTAVSEEAGKKHSLTLKNCSSSPAYTEAEIEAAITPDEDGNYSGLSGNYVGGIVGFNSGAKLEECNTIQETAGAKGYVVGKKYVGGIAGFNAGIAGSSLVGGQDNRNQANVVGLSYVGGIVGCNAAAEMPVQGANAYEAAIKEEYSSHIVLENWMNEGIVVAFESYVGGITGCNYGEIIDCSSNVDPNSGIQALTQVTSSARYAGGIAGYNQGKIYKKSGGDINAATMISGSDYVGGIVGYNDIGGQIANYALRGGYITGKRFVGGYIGLNVNDEIFDAFISCNPNEITGDYFVGGVIGGNLVPMKKKGAILAYFKTDNFLGELTAEHGAFVGGFIGYNYLLSPEVTAELVRETANSLCPVVESHEGWNPWEPIASADSGEIDRSLLQLEGVLETLLAEHAYDYGLGGSTPAMTITGDKNAGTQTRLGSITALAYVGGVIGYNQESTSLKIQNVENITPVTATAYVTKEEIPEAGEKKFSYAGGMIGKVAPNVTLENCRNRDVGEVRTQGTYTGGLAEINYGKIVNCEAGSIGDGNRDYVGGLVGVNAYSIDRTGKLQYGLIQDCAATGTIMGKSYVGGLAAENYGYIRNPLVKECAIVGSGEHIGGVSGYGYYLKRGEDVIESIIEFWDDVELDVTISGGGTAVGAIVGTNAGLLNTYSSIKITNGKEKEISGLRNVGGFIGVQMADTTLRGFTNYANVEAEIGYAGGIVACLKGTGENNTIEDCDNIGEVKVLSEDSEVGDDDTAAGGITAINHGIIRRCRDFAAIEAGSGYSGGIVAINYGQDSRIETCEVNPSGGMSAQSTLEFVGDQYVGGIAAKNQGTIKDSSVQDITLQNRNDTRSGYIGGICGVNQGTIENCSVGVKSYLDEADSEGDYMLQSQEAAGYVAEAAGSIGSDGTCSFKKAADGDNSVILISNAAGVSMGGIAGLNEGTIRGKSGNREEQYAVVAAELRFLERSMAYYGYMGGIAGVNEGSIRGYEFSGLVNGTANDPMNIPEYNPNYDYEQNGSTVYGYGGIAGLNGKDTEKSDAAIRNCNVNYAKIQGSGDANNRTNVGGIAGVNGTGAEIGTVRFGNICTIADEWKLPLITTTKNNGKGNTIYRGSVWVGADEYGHAGGVAGYNLGLISNVNGWSTETETVQSPKTYWEARDSYFVSGQYEESPLSFVDETGVFVVSGAGHTGGITGFNRRTGSISKAVTGRNWLVYSDKHGQDNGTGGIIGYNVSEKDQEACDNHATVIKTAKDSNSVGGFTGRNETSTSSAWRVYDCRNYGIIYGNERVAGMIGHWKYRGGTLEKCYNYGKISSKSNYSAGMAGIFYAMINDENVYFIDCENHGQVGEKNGQTAGGMMAFVNGSCPTFNLRFSGCVNTGLIGGKTSAGIAATNGKAVMYLDYCTNYGYSLGGDNSDFCGLTINNPKSMTECFGVTDRTVPMRPITQNSTSDTKGGYFFGQSVESRSSFFWVKEVTARGDLLKPERLLTMIDGWEADAGAENAYFASGQRGEFELAFNQPIKLEKLSLQWNRDAASGGEKYRYYRYNLYCYDENGQLVYSDENVSEAVGQPAAHVHTIDLEEGETVKRVVISNITSEKRDGGKTGVALTEFKAYGCVTDENHVPKEGYSSNWNQIDPSGDWTANWSALKHVGNTYTRTRKEDMKEPISDPVDQKEDSKYGIPLYWEKNEDNEISARDVDTKVEVKNLGGCTEAEILLTGQKTERLENSVLSYQLFKKLNADLFLQNGTDFLSTPKVNKEAVDKGGYYQVTWGAINQAQYYEVEYRYYAADGSPMGEVQNRQVYVTQIDIPSDYQLEDEMAKTVKVKVRAARKKNSGEILHSENWSDEVPFTFGIQLPIPQVHWELVKLGNEQCYRIVLDNKQEYEAFVAEQKRLNHELELGDITVCISKGNLRMNVAKGECVDDKGNTVFQKGDGKGNQTITSYAMADKQDADGNLVYARSPQNVREAQLPALGNYNQTGTGEKLGNVTMERTAKTEKVGFFGKTIDTLYYQTTLKANSDWVLYYRTELVARNHSKLGGIPVAYAVAPQTRTSPTSSEAFPVVLNGFPSDFLEEENGAYKYQDVIVRMYPTKMSNDIFYQGWQMKKEDGTTLFSEAELMDLSVTDSGRIASSGKSLISGTTLHDGYVVEYAGNDQYTLYYNTLLRGVQEENKNLEEKEGWRYDSNQQKTYMRYQLVYHRLYLDEELKDKVQKKPVAYASAYYNPTSSSWQNGDYDEDEQFVLTWDQDASVDEENQARPPYVNENNEAPYAPDGEYRLTLEGITQDGRISVITQNQVIKTATRDEKGRYNRYHIDASTWAFTNIRATLMRVGTQDAKGNTEKFPSTLEKEFPMRIRLSTIGQPSAALKKIGGVVQKDGLNYVVTFTGLVAAEEIAATDYYEITVASKTEEREKKFQVKCEPSQEPGAAISVDTDLTGFTRSDSLGITVRAIAYPNTAGYTNKYRSGMNGAERQMTLPSQLFAPDMGQPEDAEANMKATAEKNLSVEDFEKKGAITLSMKPAEYEEDPFVQFQVALQIFRTEAEAKDPDAKPLEVKNLPWKDDVNRTYMARGTSVTDAHTYVLKEIQAEYAGKWLRVYLRAVSQNSISSVWTDLDQEDDNHTKVVPYRIFQLPQVRLNPVELPAETAIEEQDYDFKGVDGNVYTVTARQRSCSFTTVDYADDYHITMIQTPQAAERVATPSNAMVVRDVDELSIHRLEDGSSYQITYESTEARSVDGKAESQILSLDGKNEVKLPYKKEIALDIDENPYSITVQAVLRAERVLMEDESGETTERVAFTLVLPDFENLYDVSKWEQDGEAFTQQLLIQSLAGDRADYFDSKWAWMAEESDGDSESDGLKKQEVPIEMNQPMKAEEEPKKVTDHVQCSSIANTAYELNDMEGRVQYLVSVRDLSEAVPHLIGVYAVPYLENVTVDGYDMAVWFPEEFGKYQGREVQLCFRSVYTASGGGGISAWSEMTYDVTLPELPAGDPVELQQALSEAMEYDVAAAGRARSTQNAILRKLQVRQTQVTWFHEAANYKETGYDLVIHGENMQQDYRLHLDLQQDLRGTFPGLAEYMTETGKVLYTVSYDLEGDSIPQENPVTATPSDAIEIATPSDAIETATPPNTAAAATPSDAAEAQIGVVSLKCILKAEYVTEDGAEGIRFTLTLPDASLKQLGGKPADWYRDVYEDGLYNTEELRVAPVMVNKYYQMPEIEWFWVEKSASGKEEEMEADSEDGELENDRN